MHNKKFRKIIALLTILVMIVVSIINVAPKQVQAADNSKKVVSVELNTSKKYLYLGEKGANTYQFTIKNDVGGEGTSYFWYVKTDKGNPNSVTINRKTGVVTAKEVGTAYIRCKITRGDGTAFRPEAKVIVRNNITKVELSNIPKDQTITAGIATDLIPKVLDTAAGKDVKTQGIIRFQIEEDTAGVQYANDQGSILPVKEGQFKVRAVCFQSIAEYKLWKAHKTRNATYITAASDWVMIKVNSANGVGVVSTQEHLNKLLTADSIDQITLSTEKAITFIIPKRNYSNKTLIINTANADVENHGLFKEITVNAIKDSTWKEFTIGNTIYLNDDAAGFVAETDADVKLIVIDQPNSLVNIEVTGIVNQIIVRKNARVNISGSQEQIPVAVENTAGGSAITTSTPLKLELFAKTDIQLKEGAEETTLNKSESKVVVKIENKTQKEVAITTTNSNRETVEGGKTVISGETVGGGGTPPSSPIVPATTTATQIATNGVAGTITSVTAPAKDGTSVTLPSVPAGYSIAIKSSDKTNVIAANGTITPPDNATTVALVFTVTNTSTGETADTASIQVVVPAKTTATQIATNGVAGTITSVTAPAKDGTSVTLPSVPAGYSIAIKSSDKTSVIAANGTITPPDSATTVSLVFTVTNTSTGETADTSSIQVVVPAKTTATQIATNGVAGTITSVTAPAKDGTSVTLPSVPAGYSIAIKSSDKTNVIAVNGTITPPDNATTVALVFTVTNTSTGETADTASIQVVVPAKTTATQIATNGVAGTITSVTAPAKDGTSLTLPSVPAGYSIAIKSSDKTNVIAANGTITPPDNATTVALEFTVTNTSTGETADTASIQVVVTAKTTATQIATNGVAGTITSVTAPAKDGTSLTLPSVPAGYSIAIKSSDKTNVIAANGTITPPDNATTVALEFTVTNTSTGETADTASIQVVVPAKTTATQIATNGVAGTITSVTAPAKDGTSVTLPSVPAGYSIAIKSSDKTNVIAANGTITPPDNATTVALEFTVTNTSTGETADTASIQVVVPAKTTATQIATNGVAGTITSVTAPAKDGTSLTLPSVPAGYSIAIKSSDKTNVIAANGTITPPDNATTVALEFTVTNTSTGETADTASIQVVVPAKTTATQIATNGVAGTITSVTAPAKDGTSVTLPSVPAGYSIAIKSSDKTNVIAANGTITPPDNATTVALEFTVTNTSTGETADTASIQVVVTAKTTATQIATNGVAGTITSVTAPAKDGTSLTLPSVPAGYSIAIKSSDKTNVIAANGTVTPPDSATTVSLVFTVTNTSTGETADTASIQVVVPKKTILSTAPIAGNITVVNNVETLADTVTVTGLVAGDEVKVYTASAGGAALAGTSGIVAGGATSVTITLTANLGTGAGSVWVTVTNAGKEESTPRVNATYLAEDYSSDVLTAWNEIGAWWNDTDEAQYMKPVEGTDTNIITMAHGKVSVAGITITVTVYGLNGYVASDGTITYQSTQKIGVAQFTVQKGENSMLKQVGVIIPAN